MTRAKVYAVVFGAAAIALLSARSADAQVMYTNKVVGSNGRPQCLAVKDGRIANSSPLIIWDCVNGDLSQTFTFQGDGTLRVGAPGSQYCVAAYDGVKRGTRIGVWQCQPGHPTQKLSLGMYLDLFFVNSNPTLCLGVQNASRNPGSPIIGWDCSKTGNDNQAWSAARMSAPPPALAAPGLRPPSGSVPPTATLAPNPDIISHNGSAIVAAGAGNIVAAGAGNIVAAGAGNLQAAGNHPANIVAAGAGNIVAAGAGNMTARQYSVQSVGGANINQILQSAQNGDVNAQYQAALYYAQHNDMVNGYAWAAIAAAHGNGSAASSRDGWANSMTKQQIQQAVLVIASRTR